MRPTLLALLLIFLGLAIAAATGRLYVIYRRRKRWKALMTSHHSLHVARERIITAPPPDED